MKKLLQKLGMLKEQEVQRRIVMSADEIKPFFESLGIDIETMGFPNMSLRHELHPIKRYDITFCDVRATPKVKRNTVFEEGELKIIIEGEYCAQAKASYKDSSGIWNPGRPSYYRFSINDNRLEITKLN